MKTAITLTLFSLLLTGCGSINRQKTLNTELIELKGIQIALYATFGQLGYLPDGDFEQEIIRAVKTDEPFSFTNPVTGETRRILCNRLTDFGPRHIILASPWVYGDQRVVVYGDGRGREIDEKKYQQEIQKEEVEMLPFKKASQSTLKIIDGY